MSYELMNLNKLFNRLNDPLPACLIQQTEGYWACEAEMPQRSKCLCVYEESWTLSPREAPVPGLPRSHQPLPGMTLSRLAPKRLSPPPLHPETLPQGPSGFGGPAHSLCLHVTHTAGWELQVKTQHLCCPLHPGESDGLWWSPLGSTQWPPRPRSLKQGDPLGLKTLQHTGWLWSGLQTTAWPCWPWDMEVNREKHEIVVFFMFSMAVNRIIFGLNELHCALGTCNEHFHDCPVFQGLIKQINVLLMISRLGINEENNRSQP